ncbi:glutathione-independent formaldehyde dehydrogenase [Microbispora bryophytorum]|uniref:Glutathione-independent formaldehyde dehydrogenase n=1 Tax=Microbispora bryophytorum subsp. camponoti TaxID=1677852 RepID=A0ABR8L1A9_9ACTN|nr:glutathione-independent formaldehyde dehydrogenase [Microbispora camponoti]MBD3142501.1 glutathione-independent formaldehyde dehydrogenase [Microbispora camponoti]
MKAVVYVGPRQVRVTTVPDARIERHTDVLVRVTTSNICGSDLHMYEGRTSFAPGRVLGHENLGEVVEIGSAVDRVKVGDMVCLPFNISCGFCANCEKGLTAFCLTTNPDPCLAGAAYGYADMGPYNGGQAELLRVPYGDFNCLVLPEDARDKQTDYVMLADVWPTGWHATMLACVQPGDTVAIYGAGPVGLMAAYSALLRNASCVMVIDHHQDRLAKAEEIGAIPIDDSRSSPVEQILELTQGIGADRGCECVGFQAHDSEGSERPNMTLNALVKSVKFTGNIAVVGLFLPRDPSGRNDLYKRGEMAIDYGTFWYKGQTMSTGQCNVKNYNRQLCALIHEGGARPSWIVSHELDLDDAPEAYAHFDAREKGWTKVVLHPGKAG